MNIPEENTIQTYPVGLVLFEFSLFGGMVGGFTIGLLLSGFGGIVGVFFATLAGLIAGFAPALLTALCLVKKRFHIHSWSSYVYLFIVGFISTFFCAVLVVITDDNNFNWFIINILSIVGGWSAMVTGKICLPKK